MRLRAGFPCPAQGRLEWRVFIWQSMMQAFSCRNRPVRECDLGHRCGARIVMHRGTTDRTHAVRSPTSSPSIGVSIGARGRRRAAPH